MYESIATSVIQLDETKTSFRVIPFDGTLHFFQFRGLCFGAAWLALVAAVDGKHLSHLWFSPGTCFHKHGQLCAFREAALT
jgi:hypothetical protein